MCICNIHSSKSCIGNNSNQANKEIFKSRILNLDIPGKELNVNKIHRANNFFPGVTDCCCCFFFVFFFCFFWEKKNLRYDNVEAE